MSILSLAQVAADRDVTGRDETMSSTKRKVPDSGEAEPNQSTSDALLSAIPTETLAVYTGVVGIFAASDDAGVTSGYLPFRWWAFGTFLALTGAAVVLAHRVRRSAKNKTRFPVLEVFIAVLAAAVWGLAMPGSPLAIELTGTARTITISTITLLGTALVTFLSSYMTKGAEGQVALMEPLYKLMHKFRRSKETDGEAEATTESPTDAAAPEHA